MRLYWCAMDMGELAHARLHAQQLTGHTCTQPAQVVARLGAVQAQDYASALWAIGSRLPQATVATVEQAIADGAIVRTWPMRGTLHFVAAADVRWMLALLTPRIVAASARRRQQLALDDATFARSKGVCLAALHGGRCLSREALYQALEQAQIATAGQRGYHILWRLAQDGVICGGPPAGKQQTFVLLDDWAPPAPVLSHDAALAELARRYFTGHGPATVQDFAWWSGLPAAAARAGLDMVRQQLLSVTVAGEHYWLADGGASLQPRPDHAYLLPGFDEYLLGYRDRRAVLKPEHSGAVVPGNNGVFMPTIALDGRIAGTWKRTIGRGAVAVAYHPFAPLSDSQRHTLDDAAARYARFLGLALRPG